MSAEPQATVRREDRLYEEWLERSTYSTALMYSAFIGILLPAFHFVLRAIPHVPPDSLALRLVCSACSAVVLATLLFFPKSRPYAVALQMTQVVLALIVVSVLVVNSGDHNLYIASGLLVIIGAQNAFYSSRMLAAGLAAGFAFMAFYSAFRGIFWTQYSLITLAIYATAYILAFIPAALHIRSEQNAIRSRLKAQQASDDLEEAHSITHLGKWAQDLRNGSAECSTEVMRIFGFAEDTPSTVLPELYRHSVHPEDRSDVERELQRSQSSGAQFTIDHRIVLQDGNVQWVQLRGKHEYDESGRAIRRLGTVMNITARKEAELSLERLARYDPLTALPNRSMLQDALDEALRNAQRAGELCAVLFLDLDRFKDINDTLGHSVGDMLLKSVAARLRSLLPPNTLVARWGGDEFVALILNAGSEHAVERMCQQLVHGFAMPFLIDSYEFSVNASIGAALYPKDGSDPEVLIRNADTAMYNAKEQALYRYALFAPQMHAVASQRHFMQSQLQTALLKNGLSLYYQPIVDASSNCIVAAEALLRWTDAEGRVHPPSEFISLAEDTGAILPIGKWVLEQSVQQAMRWRMNGIPLAVSVNISPRQLASAGFVETLAQILNENAADPSILEIEITESGLVPNAEAMLNVLQRIKHMGIRIAVDDFGTGYSAFSYLKRLPLDTLKIDRTFVDGIERDVDRSIAESIISIAHKLGLSVTAEGVETAYQREVLAALGCDRLQGFHICVPLPLRDLQDFVRRHPIYTERARSATPRALKISDF